MTAVHGKAVRMSYPLPAPEDVGRLEALIAVHVPSDTYPQCSCGNVPAGRCWLRAVFVAQLARLKAGPDVA